MEAHFNQVDLSETNNRVNHLAAATTRWGIIVLKQLRLTNFRAFSDQTFNFKKLNVFIGRNNSGKSSALSAINVIAQTMQNSELDSSPILLNGAFDQLGTYLDVVHGNHPRRPMALELSFDEYSMRVGFKYRTQRRQIELSEFFLRHDSRPIYHFTQKKDSYDIAIMGQSFESFAPGIGKRKPYFNNFWPYRNFLRPSYREPGDVDRQLLKKIREIEDHLYRSRRSLERRFSQFDSVSPFRDQPQRTYLYSGETASRVGVTGSNMAAMLASDASKRGSHKRNLEHQISAWFNQTGIAKGLSVETLTPRHFEICVISNDGSKHNICDVGFGCSQVLPVLVSGLNLFAQPSQPYGCTFLVQEPEIHLHPDAQAALGSFFASLAMRRGQIFIETHSDNLVLRIATHVALGDLEPSDVAIFFVSDTADERVTEIAINSNGSFTPDWPEGFFPQRQAESLRLARAANGFEKGSSQHLLDFTAGS